MPPFTQINLLEIEDSVAGRVDGVEGRFGRKHLNSRDLGISHFRYAPGFRSENAHRHREQEEAYVVVAGHGRMLLNGEVIELRQWDAVRVAPEVVRAFEAGPEGLELLAVGGPKPEGGDGERATADWPASEPED
ncbi:MAG: cupin domain-containing protein [Thermoleophilaceae bacterium]|jgi:mannose-6-phosphate isomerase-like protein (cupin superfamily)